MRKKVDPCQKYVGLPEAEAVRQIKADGLTSRIRSRDGQAFMGTCDVQHDRVNLGIENGVITSAHIG